MIKKQRHNNCICENYYTSVQQKLFESIATVNRRNPHDFQIEKRTFEIGGKNKGKKQIETAEEGYVVKDQIEYSSGNILPLWWFGLNY